MNGSEFKIGNTEIRIKQSSKQLTMLWLGEADNSGETERILSFFDIVEKNAIDMKLTIEVNLCRLSYMNSENIGLVMNFLMSLVDRGIRVKMVFDTSIYWQNLVKRCAFSIFDDSKNIAIIDKQA